MARELVTSETKSAYDQAKLSKQEQPSIIYNKNNNYVFSRFKSGQIGGAIKNGELHINYAELPEEMRGQGHGKAMYRALIDHAHDMGYRVFSDSTVEMPAVRVYESLKKEGYDVQKLPGGGELPPHEDLPEGALFGRDASQPVYEIRPKSEN